MGTDSRADPECQGRIVSTNERSQSPKADIATTAVCKQSLKRAFAELEEAQTAKLELPDATDLFKLIDKQ